MTTRDRPPTQPPALPPLSDQAQHLISIGVAELAGIDPAELRRAAAAEVPGALLALRPDRAPASLLAPLLRHGEKAGFVVVDMTDLDEFEPIPEAGAPTGAVYLVEGIDRGDHMSNWSPDEALPSIIAAGRTPLTVTEGIHWLLQSPDTLQRNHAFMTIGSRRRKTKGLDSRTPAIWLSNGTGRDGAGNRDAPKVGWCWAGNRHTWLGFASAARRRSPFDE